MCKWLGAPRRQSPGMAANESIISLLTAHSIFVVRYPWESRQNLKVCEDGELIVRKNTEGGKFPPPRAFAVNLVAKAWIGEDRFRIPEVL